MRGQSSFVQHNLVIALNMGVGDPKTSHLYIADKKPNYPLSVKAFLTCFSKNDSNKALSRVQW